MTPSELIESYVGEVIRRLPRRMRSDVGFELRALLGEELQAKASAAGGAADGAMAMEMLNAFGQPGDVAARYHTDAFDLIEPTLSPLFTQIAAAGVAIQWTFSLIATARDGGLVQWWTHAGLGAFWWPGFLLLCFATGAWMRRRWPGMGRWKPSSSDGGPVNRPLMAFAILSAAAGVAAIAALPWLVERYLPAAAAPAFAYEPSFWRVRAVWVLPLWAAQFLVMAVVLAEGRWRRATRNAETVVTAAICGLMAWWLASGNIFVAKPTNDLAKFVLTLILFLGLIDLAMRLYRRRAGIAPPKIV